MNVRSEMKQVKTKKQKSKHGRFSDNLMTIVRRVAAKTKTKTNDKARLCYRTSFSAPQQKHKTNRTTK